MENNFNGFMLFMAFVLTFLFCLSGVGFIVSFLCSLIICVFIRAMYILYKFLVRFLGGINIGRKSVKREV